QILEEVVRQVYGEGEARKRSLAWDPYVQKALGLVAKAELLVKDPQRFVTERDAEARMTGAARPQ
ncbi:MAG TPA: hypothetical protein VF310_05040, partial [Vicinamibacteria bacterium]